MVMAMITYSVLILVHEVIANAVLIAVRITVIVADAVAILIHETVIPTDPVTVRIRKTITYTTAADFASRILFCR